MKKLAAATDLQKVLEATSDNIRARAQLLIAMPTGFPAAIPANCSFQLCSFRGSLVTTQAAEASRAADDVVRRRRKIDGTAATSHAARCNRLRSLFNVGADTFASAPCMC